MQYNEIPSNTLQLNLIQYNTLKYLVISCNNIEYNIIPCNTMKCYATPFRAPGFPEGAWYQVKVCGEHESNPRANWGRSGPNLAPWGPPRTSGAPKGSLGPETSPFGGPRSAVEVRKGAQVHAMDASHPANCVEVFRTPFSPSRPSLGPRGGQKGAQKWECHISSKHKSYLRYRDGLWRFNQDFYLFRFGSRKLATWADIRHN